MNKALERVRDGRLFPFGFLKLLLYTKIAGIDECRNVLMGVLPEHQGRGYDVLMHADLAERHAEFGYTAAEMSWVLASNKVIVNTAENTVGSIRDKEYALFEKQLG